ncbi:MAG: hypothetical protein ACFB50_10415 [Rubrobacteraceae bacterium]
MDKQTYMELKRKIRARAEKELEALDIVWTLINKSDEEHNEERLFSEFRDSHISRSSAVSSSREPSPEKADGHSRRIRITEEVREALSKIRGEFTKQDVLDLIAEKHPNTEVHGGSVSNALARMVKREEGVEVVEEGYGSAPNIYRKIDVPSPQREPVQERAEVKETRPAEEEDNKRGKSVIDF